MIRSWSRHPRRSVPIQRSQIAFTRGARIGVRMIPVSAPRCQGSVDQALLGPVPNSREVKSLAEGTEFQGWLRVPAATHRRR